MTIAMTTATLELAVSGAPIAPMKICVEIRRAWPEELPVIRDLFDCHLGVADGRLAALTSLMQGAGLVLAAVEGNALLGAGTATILSRDHASEAFPPDHRGALVDDLLAGIDGNIGVLNTLAVDPAARSRGLGTALVAERLRWLARNGADVVLSFAWRHPEHSVRVAGALWRNGLRPVREVPGFWSQRHSTTSPCDHCGPCCVCVAVIYRLACASTPSRSRRWSNGNGRA